MPAPTQNLREKIEEILRDEVEEHASLGGSTDRLLTLITEERKRISEMVEGLRKPNTVKILSYDPSSPVTDIKLAVIDTVLSAINKE